MRIGRPCSSAPVPTPCSHSGDSGTRSIGSVNGHWLRVGHGGVGEHDGSAARARAPGPDRATGHASSSERCRTSGASTPARTNAFNALVRTVVARHPGVVSVIDMERRDQPARAWCVGRCALLRGRRRRARRAARPGAGRIAAAAPTTDVPGSCERPPIAGCEHGTAGRARRGDRLASRCQTCGRGSNRSWPGLRSPLATSAWSGAAVGARPWGRGRVAFLLIYPDTYEIGLPNQGLQILYEILNERADAVAERAYAPWIDMEASMRARGPAAVQRRHPPRRRRLRRARLQPVGRARLHEPAEPGRPRRRARSATRTARPTDPIVIAGGHCTYNPEPLAEYVDAFVIGDGEEVDQRDRRGVGAWKRGGRASREAVLRELATIPGVYVPAMYDVEYDGQCIRAVTPRYRRRARGRRQAHGRRPRRLAVPEAAARAARRGRARPAQRRDLPRLHPRLPLLPGRDDHPPGARAARGAGAHDGPRGPAPHRLRRGRAHVAVERRLLRHRRRRRRPRRATRKAPAA